MPVAETSRQAYKSLKDLGDKQRQVLDTLGELGIASDQDIAEALGWEINRVTGRRNELVKFNLVKQHGVKTNQYGNKAKTWCVTDPYAQRKIDTIKQEEKEAWRPQAVSWLAD